MTALRISKKKREKLNNMEFELLLRENKQKQEEANRLTSLFNVWNKRLFKDAPLKRAELDSYMQKPDRWSDALKVPNIVEFYTLKKMVSWDLVSLYQWY